MSYVNQVPGLPFRYDAPTSQLVQYRNDMPPYIPTGLNCPPQFQYIVPVICAMIANECVQRHGQHPGRMFLFNQLSANNWVNNDFAMAVATVIDILSMNLYKQIFRTAEEGLNKTVSETLSMLCSLNFQTFPALQSVTAPDIVYETQRNIQAFFNVSNEVNNFKNRAAGYQQPQQFPQQMMVNPSLGGYQSPQQTPQYSQAIGSNQGSNTSIFNNQPRNMQVNNPSPVQGGETGKYDYLKPVQAIVDQKSYFTKEPLAVKNNTNFEVYSYPIEEVEKPLLWGPTSKQYYPITINPFTHTFQLEEFGENSKRCASSYKKPLGDEDMDRKRHTITSMQQVQSAFIPDEFGTREESLEDSINNMFHITATDIEQAKETNTYDEIKTHLLPDWGIDNFLESAIFNGRLIQDQVSSNYTDCTAYRVYKMIAKPIICKADHSVFLKSLSSCKTFREVAAILSETLTINSDDRSLINFCYEIEKILTKEINEVISNRMSIPHIDIDSFIDDVNDLPEYLGNTFGAMYKRIFLEFQRDYIPSMLGVCEEALAETLRENLGNDSDKTIINFISQDYSFTYLNVNSYELGIKPYQFCASSLSEDDNPLMHKVVRGIFRQDKVLELEALHNLIITSDNKIYEVFEGMIGNDFYTIREVN